MRLRLQAFINNEIRITCGSDLFTPPRMGDKSEQRKTETYAHQHQLYINAKKAIRKLYNEQSVTKSVTVADAYQLTIDGKSEPINQHQKTYKTFPKEYKTVQELPNGRLIVVKEPIETLFSKARCALDLISKSQQPVKKHDTWGKPQKPKAFTKNARHKLLECGEAIDKLGLKDSSSLLTLTLPGGTPEAKDALARWSGWIVNRQLQIIRRHPRSKEIYWFFVWENQARGALHQHWCVASPDYDLSKEISHSLAGCWFSLLFELGTIEQIDMFQREGNKGSWKDRWDKWVWDEQRVEKSVAKYFAKYASKGVSSDKKGEDNVRINQSYPSRWFGSGKNLKEVCKAWRIDFSIVNIHKDEVEYLKSILIDLISDYGIVKKYAYSFQAIDRETKYVFNSGETEILYIDANKYVDCFAELNQQLSPNREAYTVKTPFHWNLQFCREVDYPENVFGNNFDSRLGEYVNYSP